MIGTKLAHFTITAHLGSGGMGEVYQATDSKLGRSVAIKLLPEAFSDDSERAARFEREARVLASLNHPNIAAIHGIEQSNERTFLVMEFVGGETLAERIKRGPIPIDEALPIAKQIADALEAAHEKGIVHRDLKPANIKITPEGQVKVLDFGLAKAFAGEATEVNLSNSPTLSMMGTEAGVILGTAAYMSPEQAKGSVLDRRTDIFSFGAVLYEMLTGRPVFQGKTLTEILAEVMKGEPDWSRLPNDTPSVIRRLLERSLRKDRTRRLQTATDVLIEIEEAEKAEQADRTALPNPTRHRERRAWIVAGLALATAAAALAALYFREPPSAQAPETRMDLVTPASTAQASFALSPDGRRIAAVASEGGQRRLWLRPLDGTPAQWLVGTEGAVLPFWSPDSKSVGFFAGGKLKRIDIGSGLPQVLADAAGGRGGAWSSDDIILFAAGPGRGLLFRVPASGGEAVAVTSEKVDSRQDHRLPQFLPDGRQFLFHARGSADVEGIYLGSLDSSETKRLTAADTAGLYYFPSGWLFYVREGTLLARRFDLQRGELTGDPVGVADRVMFNNSGGDTPGATPGQAAFSVSAAGLIAYRSAVPDVRQLTWFDRTGKVLGKLGAPDENSLLDPVISPDGRRVAIDRTVQGNSDIWIMDESRMTRFTFDSNRDEFPIWSPDGTRIAFRSNRKGTANLYWKPSNGAGSEELLLESGGAPGDWSPDGRSLLVSGNGNLDIQILPLQGERKVQLFVHTDFSKTNSRFSPNGRWVSYQSSESGQPEIYVRPFPGPGGVWQVSSGGGISARWRPDNKELYYIALDGKLMATSIAVQGATLVSGTPVALFQTQIALGPLQPSRGQYAVAPDGRFLINVTLGDNVTSPITLIQNWKAPAK